LINDQFLDLHLIENLTTKIVLQHVRKRDLTNVCGCTACSARKFIAVAFMLTLFVFQNELFDPIYFLCGAHMFTGIAFV
jgi:hypothetical protein